MKISATQGLLTLVMLIAVCLAVSTVFHKRVTEEIPVALPKKVYFEGEEISSSELDRRMEYAVNHAVGDPE